MRAFQPEQVDQLVRDGWWSGQVWQDRLDRHASESPDKAALVDPPNKADHTGTEPRRLTWAEVEALTDEALERRLCGPPAGEIEGDRPEPDLVWIHQELRRPGVTLELLHVEYLAQQPTD